MSEVEETVIVGHCNKCGSRGPNDIEIWETERFFVDYARRADGQLFVYAELSDDPGEGAIAICKDCRLGVKMTVPVVFTPDFNPEHVEDHLILTGFCPDFKEIKENEP